MNFHKTLRRIKKGVKHLYSSLSMRIDVRHEYYHNDYDKDDVDLDSNIYLHYWKLTSVYPEYPLGTENLGDYLSKVVVNYMVKNGVNEKIVSTNKSKKTLYAIGSIIGLRCQDAVIWGSGILSPTQKRLLRMKRSKLDIRAVRGPKTREVLERLGKACPSVYGDPAILMPYVYTPIITEKKGTTIVLNHGDSGYSIPEYDNIKVLDILTTDYTGFIDQIANSEIVISSSLHGIILAEAYGTPAILLLKENQDTFKYKDWYYSTGRREITVAHSIDEALTLIPMPIPDLRQIQNSLFSTFPYDLWNCNV